MLTQFKRHRRFLFCVFIGALLIRAAAYEWYFSASPTLLAYDAQAYHEVGRELAAGRGLVNADGTSHFLRVPGYATFLSIGYRLFAGSVYKTLWLQVVLAALIPLLLFALCMVLLPARVLLAKIVAVVAVVHVGFIIFSSLVMAETVFLIFFLLFAILFFSVCLGGGSWQLMFWAATFLGVASLVRPLGHYLLLPIIIVATCAASTGWQRAQYVSALCGGWLLVVGGWLLRNFLLTGFLFFHTLPGLHFLKHSAARIMMQVHQCSYTDGLTRVHDELVHTLAGAPQVPAVAAQIHECVIAERVSFACALRHPFVAMKLWVANMVKTCFSLYSGELLMIDSGGELPLYESAHGVKNMLLRFLQPRVRNPLLRVAIYYEIVMFFFIITGWIGFMMLALQQSALRRLLFALILIMGSVIAATLACGFARLRLPIEPFLVIGATYFWVWMFEHIKKRVV